jgi:atrial natriuretic peptide receptor A
VFSSSTHEHNFLFRWVLKISDFGLGDLLAEEESGGAARLLYRAPELLRLGDRRPVQVLAGVANPPNPTQGSQKGDVYSFAIILYEIHGRRGPFGDTGLSSDEVLTRVLSTGPAAFRPPFDRSSPLPRLQSTECRLENCMDVVKETMAACWAESQELRFVKLSCFDFSSPTSSTCASRPDFKIIRTRLRPLRKGMKANIFDNMISMMEVKQRERGPTSSSSDLRQ